MPRRRLGIVSPSVPTARFGPVWGIEVATALRAYAGARRPRPLVENEAGPSAFGPAGHLV